jgi:hypothetical protein
MFDLIEMLGKIGGLSNVSNHQGGVHNSCKRKLQS